MVLLVLQVLQVPGPPGPPAGPLLPLVVRVLQVFSPRPLVLQVLQVFWSWSSRSCGRPGHAGRPGPPGLLSRLSGPSSLQIFWSSGPPPSRFSGKMFRGTRNINITSRAAKMKILVQRFYCAGFPSRSVTSVTLAGKAAEAEGPASFCRSKAIQGRNCTHAVLHLQSTQLFSLSGLFCEDMCHPSAESLPHP